MRTYVSPIGYNSTRVTRPVLSHGLDSGDKIVLVRPSDDGDDARADEALDDVKRLVQEIQPDVSVDISRLQFTDFGQDVLACDEIIRERAEESDELIVNFAGGPREIFLPFATAALAATDQIDRAFLFSDVEGTVQSIDLPNLRDSVSPSERGTLETITELGGQSTVPALDDYLERSKSTITRHISVLENAEFVETWREGKTKHVQIRPSGRLLISDR